jgi:hypothetical protein
MREPSKPPNGPEQPSDEVLDRRLREALGPPPGVARRIARRALDGEGAGEAKRARPWLGRPAVAAAGLALAAVALAAHLLLPRLRLGEGASGDAGRIAGPGSEVPAEAPVRGARYSITNRGEVIVVQALDGGPSSLRANRATPEWRPSVPGRKLLVHGGTGP